MTREPILVIEDDRDVRESLADALGDEGYEVAFAIDGLSAMRYLRTHQPPSLILLDWMMPRSDGASFRRMQKADPKLAEIPVVLLTADDRLITKSAELGAVSSLPKPVDLSELLAVIARFAG